jgi:lipooligosaccharide transport system permease protein
MAANKFVLPALTPRFVPVWRRNLLVWRKLAIPSILGNFADPLIYMLGLGYGLGRLVPDIGGMPYIVFIAAGTVCFSTMNSATFEAMYSGFSRMHVQRTWEAIMNAPITLDDVALAELLWATSKSFLSGLAILIVALALGLTTLPMALWILAVIPLIGFAFAALALMITALADGYDFFMYYFTLVITPMSMLCGVFFPTAQLPEALQMLSSVLPLTHATDLVRPLILGEAPSNIPLHVLALLAYGLVAFYAAVVLFRRRLLK